MGTGVTAVSFGSLQDGVNVWVECIALCIAGKTMQVILSQFLPFFKMSIVCFRGFCLFVHFQAFASPRFIVHLRDIFQGNIRHGPGVVPAEASFPPSRAQLIFAVDPLLSFRLPRTHRSFFS